MNNYALHPEALADLDEIRAYIAEDTPDAADRVLEEIFVAIRLLVRMPRTRVRCGSSRCSTDGGVLV